jgi:hypothetical protein
LHLLWFDHFLLLFKHGTGLHAASLAFDNLDSFVYFYYYLYFWSRHRFLFGGPTVDIHKNWRPIKTAQRFSMADPKSLQLTLAVTLWPVPKVTWWFWNKIEISQTHSHLVLTRIVRFKTLIFRLCFVLTCPVTGFLKLGFHMVVTVVKIESRSFSSAQIQHFRTENTRSDYN